MCLHFLWSKIYPCFSVGDHAQCNNFNFLSFFFLLLCQKTVWMSVSRRHMNSLADLHKENLSQIPQVFAILNEKEAKRKKRIWGHRPTFPSLLSFLFFSSSSSLFDSSHCCLQLMLQFQSLRKLSQDPVQTPIPSSGTPVQLTLLSWPESTPERENTVQMHGFRTGVANPAYCLPDRMENLLDWGSRRTGLANPGLETKNYFLEFLWSMLKTNHPPTCPLTYLPTHPPSKANISWRVNLSLRWYGATFWWYVGVHMDQNYL